MGNDRRLQRATVHRDDPSRQPPPRARAARNTTVATACAMGPAGLAALLALRHFDMVARQSLWIYVLTMVAAPAVAMAANRTWPAGRAATHARVAVHCGVVGWIIYLTGWGPVLVTALTVVVVVNSTAFEARSWRAATMWSIITVAAGQGALALHVAPARLAPATSQTIGLLGLLLFVFTARLLGAGAEQRARAETAIRRSEERFRSLVQHATDTTFVVSTAGLVEYVSPAVTTLTGRSPEDLVGTSAIELVHPDDRDLLRAQIVEPVDGSDPHAPPAPSEQRFRVRREDGAWRHVDAVVSDQRANPAVSGYVVIARDVTDRVATEAVLTHRASHDHLTGLPNRALLVDRIEQAIVRRKRSAGPPPVVMLLDLDRFKAVNDGLGHRCGDEVLVELASRLQASLRAGDTVARLGGDEFVAVFEDVHGRAEATEIAGRILAEIDRPFTVLGRRATLGASVGITFVADGSDVDALLAQADSAMYLAKARVGGDRVHFFDAAAPAVGANRPHTADDLATALAGQQFELFYQPIVSAHDGAVTGAEALLRWRHPRRGLLVPSDFLDAAERTGMIVPIGTWVLSEACKQVQRWNTARSDRPALGVSVNLSARQLTEPDLADEVAAALHAAGVDPSHVSVAMELSEAMLPTDDARAQETLHRLHELGVELAIDDFGNGYSSLRYVRDLPIGMLKVDRGFVDGIGRSGRDEAIVRSVIAMARDLEVTVTAEGVETQAQLAFLRDAGCDLMQGYLFGRPRPASISLPDSFALPGGRSPIPV